MSLAADRDVSGGDFIVEDVCTGIYANGYGQVGDGRRFAFRTENRQLVVEVYRPRLAGLVPQAEDVVAMAVRPLTELDVTDERSIVAAVRDAVADATPVVRNGSRPVL